MNAKDTARLFKALSGPPRIAILHILNEHPDTLTVEDLVDKMDKAGFPLEQETVSYHLKISCKKQPGTYRYCCYRLLCDLCHRACRKGRVKQVSV